MPGGRGEVHWCLWVLGSVLAFVTVDHTPDSLASDAYHGLSLAASRPWHLVDEVFGALTIAVIWGVTRRVRGTAAEAPRREPVMAL